MPLHGRQRAGRTLPHAVLGPRLTGLSARAEGRPGSGLHPAFHPDVTHYAVACPERGVLGVSFSAPPGVRVDVDGVQPHPDDRAAAAVTDTTDVVVTAATADGASTRYTLHCAPPELARLATRTSGEAPGILFALTRSSWAAVVDANGVPRLHRRVAGDRSAGFFLMPFGAGDGRRWAHVAPVEADAAPAAETAEAGGASRPPLRNRRAWVVRDGGFAPLARFTSAPPLVTTGRHDFRLLGDGAALLMTYEPAVRDFSFLSAPPVPSAAGAPHPPTAVRFDDPDGQPWGDAVETRDSAIQIVEADGRARWTWSSWGRVPLEDCASHWFPNDYAHVNSAEMTSRGVLASFRGCSTVMLIDPEAPPGDEIVWRLGASNLRPRDWAARGLGPAPLALAGDPEGGFCGQHAAALIEGTRAGDTRAGEGVPEPRLLLFDNGVHCAMNPATGAPLGRKGGDFSRAVEYALDLAHGEAVFVRDRSLGGRDAVLGGIGGHVARLADGAWLVSWGRPIPGRDGEAEAPAPDEAVTLVDPRTGEERFALLRAGPLEGAREVRALPVRPEALATSPGPLAAVFPEAAPLPSGSSGEPGTVDIAVAFSRPVADFGPATPSVEVAGGALTAVLPRFAFGKPAHGYLLRIAPSGDAPLTLRLIPGEPCGDGGICAADGTRLTGIPAPLALSLDTNGTER